MDTSSMSLIKNLFSSFGGASSNVSATMQTTSLQYDSLNIQSGNNPELALEQLSYQNIQASLGLSTTSTGSSNLDKINAYLQSNGMSSAEDTQASGTDFSPEATAKRIADFATGFFGMYYDQHKGDEGKDFQSTLKDFMKIIHDAIDQGFGEAKDALKGMGLFNGQVEENANKTYDIVQDLLTQFEAKMQKQGAPTADATAAVSDTPAVTDDTPSGTDSATPAATTGTASTSLWYEQTSLSVSNTRVEVQS